MHDQPWTKKPLAEQRVDPDGVTFPQDPDKPRPHLSSLSGRLPPADSHIPGNLGHSGALLNRQVAQLKLDVLAGSFDVP